MQKMCDFAKKFYLSIVKPDSKTNQLWSKTMITSLWYLSDVLLNVNVFYKVITYFINLHCPLVIIANLLIY